MGDDTMYNQVEYEERKERNACPECGKNDSKGQEVRNYDMMWGDADLWCVGCDIKIRNMDFG